MSLVGMQLSPSQDVPQQQQHPMLAVISGNNYAFEVDPQDRAHSHYYPPWSVQHHHHRPVPGAATNSHAIYTNSGPSGYGDSGPSGEEYQHHDAADDGHHHQQHAPSHASSGSGGSGAAWSWSGPTGGGTSYGTPSPPIAVHPHPHPHIHPHPHPHPHPQPHPHHHPPAHPRPTHAPRSSGKPKKKSGSAIISALTLLSFFFFVNMLQNCLKDQMATMNPTVMVMTGNGVRNRYNKLAEMNSREQFSTSASAAAGPAPIAASAQPPPVYVPAPSLVVQQPAASIAPPQPPPPPMPSIPPPMGAYMSPSPLPPVHPLQSPYGGGVAPLTPSPPYSSPTVYSNGNSNNNWPQSNAHNYNAGGGSVGGGAGYPPPQYDQRPDYHGDSPAAYPNLTLVATSPLDNRYNNNNNQHYPHQRPTHDQHQPQQPWWQQRPQQYGDQGPLRQPDFEQSSYPHQQPHHQHPEQDHYGASSASSSVGAYEGDAYPWSYGSSGPVSSSSGHPQQHQHHHQHNQYDYDRDQPMSPYSKHGADSEAATTADEEREWERQRRQESVRSIGGSNYFDDGRSDERDRYGDVQQRYTRIN